MLRGGQIAVIAIVGAAVLTGGGVWFAQQYGYYKEIDPQSGRADVVIVQREDGEARPLALSHFEGIDAESSPIRYRSCFVTEPLGEDEALPYEGPTPLVGPGWFKCFDAGQLTRDLESGEAVAYLSVADIRPDVDRVIAIYPDGRGFSWHQYNEKNPERGVMD